MHTGRIWFRGQGEHGGGLLVLVGGCLEGEEGGPGGQVWEVGEQVWELEEVLGALLGLVQVWSVLGYPGASVPGILISGPCHS